MTDTRPIVCFCSIAFRNQPITDIIPRIADLGYDGIEIISDHLDGRSDSELDAIRQRAAACKLRIEVVAPYFRLTRDRPELIQESYATASRFVGYARRLGAGRIRTFVDAGPTTIASAVATPDQWQRAVDGLRHITAMAPDLLFVLETHHQTLTDSPASTRRLLDLVRAANLVVNYQAESGDPLDGYRLLRADIRHFHLHHPPTATNPGYLDDGSEYLAPLLAAVLRDGYSGTMSVEYCWKGVDWDKAASARTWLRQHGI